MEYEYDYEKSNMSCDHSLSVTERKGTVVSIGQVCLLKCCQLLGSSVPVRLLHSLSALVHHL